METPPLNQSGEVDVKQMAEIADLVENAKRKLKWNPLLAEMHCLSSTKDAFISDPLKPGFVRFVVGGYWTNVEKGYVEELYNCHTMLGEQIKALTGLEVQFADGTAVVESSIKLKDRVKTATEGISAFENEKRRVATGKALHRIKHGLSPDKFSSTKGDFTKLLGSIQNADLILADPLWHKEHIKGSENRKENGEDEEQVGEMFRQLARRSAKALKPATGILAVMVGTAYLDRVFKIMTEDPEHMLPYRWTFSYLFERESGQIESGRRVYENRVLAPGWKPVLIFSHQEPDRWLGKDVVPSIRREKANDYFQYQQSVPGFIGIIKSLRLEPNSLVVDCFCHSGTTGVAALACGHRCILGDIDPVAVDFSTERIVVNKEHEKYMKWAECPDPELLPPSPFKS
jgi:hypothetical protein